MHVSDNGDGTFTNPVMPNAHWSDPAVIRAGDTFWCATSSIETCPLVQVLASRDLVNWDVAGSVARAWPADLPSIQDWSPRISRVGKAYRLHVHHTERGFAVFQAAAPAGPWERVTGHRLGDMTEQWAASVFTDVDGALYMVASNWIQPLGPDGLAFAGPRTVVAEGFLENPWLVRRGDWYWWFCSENGTDAWGVMPARSVVSAWRSRAVQGPYEKCPRPLIQGNTDFQCPNTGCPVDAPDGSWWYLYNTVEARRPGLCRQLHVDPLDWGPDGWPSVNGGAGPGLRHRKPVQGFGPTWRPEPGDEFDGPGLEGITAGILGRKWLFKREDPGAWSLARRQGWLSLRAAFPSIDNRSPANVVVQRPASAYYGIDTLMEFAPSAAGQQAGILVKELASGRGVALGIEQSNRRWLRAWHFSGDGPRVAGAVPYPGDRVRLCIDVEGQSIRCSFTGDGVRWSPLGGEYLLRFEPGCFTAFHPGLFAGETVDTRAECWAHFDWFRFVDRERPAPSSA